MSTQDQYDEAMFEYSMGNYDTAIAQLQAILAVEPTYFDAQLSLGMAYYRKGDFATAIAEGHKAEQLKPDEQLVHTNLSLFYVKAGDKQKAEHHGVQARIVSWKKPEPPPSANPSNDDLKMATPPAPKPMGPMPETPWKK
jgi:tetratricopeptide (TPR) repeat protein